jgi:hypothetical protein
LQFLLNGCTCDDLVGAGTFILGVILVFLATSWGGSSMLGRRQYP